MRERGAEVAELEHGLARPVVLVQRLGLVLTARRKLTVR